MNKIAWAMVIVAGIVVGASPSASSQEGPAVSGVFSLNPATAHGCVAVKIQLLPGETLAGVSWFHNDGTAQFPRLLLLEATPGLFPDLSQTGMILSDLSAEELGWGQAVLPTPVSSSTGEIYMVFVYPETGPTTAMGDGGGAALGMTEPPGGHTFLVSPNGLDWIHHTPTRHLAIEPTVIEGLARGASQPVELSSLIDEIAYEPANPAKPVPTKLITETRLLGPFPNPFNPRTTIQFELAAASHVKLAVFDLRGRHVATLHNGVLPQGPHSRIWAAEDSGSKKLASGVYFLRFEAGGKVQSERVLLLR